MNALKNVVLWCLCITLLSVPVVFWFLFNSTAKFDAACVAAGGVAVHSVAKSYCLEQSAFIEFPPKKVIPIPIPMHETE